MPESAPLPSKRSADDLFIVEDIVRALTGEASEGPGQLPQAPTDLRVQLERAASDFDRRTADAFGRALLDSLTEEPGNLRQLEALIILGLAHPDVLARHRISLAVEGRRLAVLLERIGDVDRARGVLELLSGYMPEERTIDQELAGLLRRSGHTDELVERYLQRAESAAEAGRVSEAIPWLQEVLLLDRTRRDVARMIRDLRYQEVERQAQHGRRNRLLLMIVVISAGLTAVVGRELRIAAEYGALPMVNKEGPETLYGRRNAIEALIGEHHFWLGLPAATGERSELDQDISDHEREQEHVRHAHDAAAQQRVDQAEAARMRGLMHAERGELARSLIEFEGVLELELGGWEHLEQVKLDVASLREWKYEGARAK